MKEKINLRILIVEDDEDDLFLLTSYFKDFTLWKIEYEWASNFSEGIKKFEEGKFDLCFVDHYLGAQTGIDFIVKCANSQFNPPMILLTGLDNISIDNEAIESGAADYIPKSDLSLSILERSIRHALERYKQKKFIENQRAKYQRLFEHSLEAIFLADANFVLTECNDVFWKILKMDCLDDLCFATLFQDPNEFELIKKDIIQTGNSHRFKVVLLDANNAEMIVNLCVWRVQESNDEKSVYQGVIHDVTELQEAQSLLMESEKFHLTGRMARIIGHEVRNPLTNIILATEELKEIIRSENEETDEMFDMVKRNAGRITSLIDDLLSSTKMLEINLQKIDAQEIVNEVIDECRDRLMLKKVELQIDGFQQSKIITVDIEKFKIVLVNIIINATEAMHQIENPKLTINFLPGQHFDEIHIRDNGIGMSKETKTKIFEPFFTARNGGLGLGMTNVKNILVQHNALLQVESEEGKGTVFYIKLPLVSGEG